jgi:hypothetical protein
LNFFRSKREWGQKQKIGRELAGIKRKKSFLCRFSHQGGKEKRAKIHAGGSHGVSNGNKKKDLEGGCWERRKRERKKGRTKKKEKKGEKKKEEKICNRDNNITQISQNGLKRKDLEDACWEKKEERNRRKERKKSRKKKKPYGREIIISQGGFTK